MKIQHAAIAATLAAVIGVTGATAAVQFKDDKPATKQSVTATPAPSVTLSPVGELSLENLLLEDRYREVTGHSFTRLEPHPGQTLGPCSDKTFAEVLPNSGVTTIATRFVGEEDGFQVVEQLAQTESAQEAKATADDIVSIFTECAPLQAGDFGFGGPVTIDARPSDPVVVYFPAFDSDRKWGGYAVFSVGTRVGTLQVADLVDEVKLAQLASEVAGLAAG